MLCLKHRYDSIATKKWSFSYILKNFFLKQLSISNLESPRCGPGFEVTRYVVEMTSDKAGLNRQVYTGTEHECFVDNLEPGTMLAVHCLFTSATGRSF